MLFGNSLQAAQSGIYENSFSQCSHGVNKRMRAKEPEFIFACSYDMACVILSMTLAVESQNMSEKLSWA